MTRRPTWRKPRFNSYVARAAIALPWRKPRLNLCFAVASAAIVFVGRDVQMHATPSKRWRLSCERANNTVTSRSSSKHRDGSRGRRRSRVGGRGPGGSCYIYIHI